MKILPWRSRASILEKTGAIRRGTRGQMLDASTDPGYNVPYSASRFALVAEREVARPRELPLASKATGELRKVGRQDGK